MKKITLFYCLLTMYGFQHVNAMNDSSIGNTNDNQYKNVLTAGNIFFMQQLQHELVNMLNDNNSEEVAIGYRKKNLMEVYILCGTTFSGLLTALQTKPETSFAINKEIQVFADIKNTLNNSKKQISLKKLHSNKQTVIDYSSEEYQLKLNNIKDILGMLKIKNMNIPIEACNKDIEKIDNLLKQERDKIEVSLALIHLSEKPVINSLRKNFY